MSQFMTAIQNKELIEEVERLRQSNRDLRIGVKNAEGLSELLQKEKARLFEIIHEQHISKPIITYIPEGSMVIEPFGKTEQLEKKV